jgi:polyferredoxin
MGRLFKLLIYLLVLGFLGLVVYAYIGPYFGVDLSARQTETRLPVTLDAN